MDPLSPIPIPAAQQWREFRFRRLPVITFLLVLGIAIFIWREHIAAPQVVGEVENITAHVISTVPGLLTELSVDRFDAVTKGQVIGKLYPMDPEALKASLTAMEIEARMLRADMMLNRERNDLNYEQLRLDHLNNKMQLALARVNLQFAEAEFRRFSELREQKLASGSEFDLAQSTRDARKEEVAELENLIERMELRLQEMKPLAANEKTPSLDQAIAAQEAMLLLTEGPVVLRAPMDGIVSAITNRAGQRVMAGAPIVTISSPRAERIVGYVRQPLTVIPKVGDSVQVRTRSWPRKTATAKVLRVGTELQAMTPIIHLRYDNLVESGLPFVINLPQELKLYPGELVDLRLYKNAN